MHKSPFIVKQDFLSPLHCESILSDIQVLSPDTDDKGEPQKIEKHVLKWEQEIIERFRPLIPEIESTYDCLYRGLEKPVFQYFPENAKSPAEKPGCENSMFARKKWVMVKDVDLVGFIWLKNYNNAVPLDIKSEVYGGKLEFPAFNFSLVPQQGTLVLYPAGPHFISVISPILLGDLYQIKLNISIKQTNGGQYFYQPQKHPGKWEQWFESYF